jgi:peptidoglycan/xylan/chitin deacetylase (PgdA/CDA1 family)
MQRQRFHPMSKSDIMMLQTRGHVIGCHSWNHRPLAALDDNELADDFKKCTEAKAQFGMSYYCYPFGGTEEVDWRALRACRSHGYEASVLNIEYSPFSKLRNDFALPREMLPQETNRYLIEAKLSGLESVIKLALR